jgi:hypothetical protein
MEYRRTAQFHLERESEALAWSQPVTEPLFGVEPGSEIKMMPAARLVCWWASF